MIRYQELLKLKKKTERRLREVEERRKRDKDNEDVIPGHNGFGYHEDENEHKLLSDYLEGIEKEITKLEKDLGL